MKQTDAQKIEYRELLKAAIKLRASGVPYSEIIERLGHWKSIQACQKAVATALADDFNNSVEAARNEIIARNEQRILILSDRFSKTGSPMVSREITRIDDQTAKLKGLYAPVKVADTDVKGNDKPKVIVYLPDNNR